MIKVGQFKNKDIVNVWFFDSGEKFAVVKFSEIGNLLTENGYTKDDIRWIEFFYVDEYEYKSPFEHVL